MNLKTKLQMILLEAEKATPGRWQYTEVDGIWALDAKPGDVGTTEGWDGQNVDIRAEEKSNICMPRQEQYLRPGPRADGRS